VNEYADFWQPELNAIAVAVAVEVLARSSLIVMLFLLKFSLKWDKKPEMITGGNGSSHIKMGVPISLS